jgi:hypothetical protein
VTRTASGISPEELSLADAYFEGQRAGSKHLSPSLNPFQSGCQEFEAWERGRLAALGQSLQRRTG